MNRIESIVYIRIEENALVRYQSEHVSLLSEYDPAIKVHEVDNFSSPFLCDMIIKEVIKAGHFILVIENNTKPSEQPVFGSVFKMVSKLLRSHKDLDVSYIGESTPALEPLLNRTKAAKVDGASAIIDVIKGKTPQ